MTDDMEKLLVEKISEIIIWGCDVYNIPVLIVNTQWSFSSRYVSSSVRTCGLQFDVFFALNDFYKSWELGGVFYENYKKINNDPVIKTFTGSGPEILTSLVCHEMAHVFERLSLQEAWFPSKISAYYGFNDQRVKPRAHHNKLWRIIYRELKTLFMPEYLDIKINKSIELIKVKGDFKTDFYIKNKEAL